MHSGARRPPDRGSGAPRWPRPCGARPLRGPRPGSPSPRAVPGRAGPGRAVPCRAAAPRRHPHMEPRESWAALAAGGVAGVCVDLILFPLDTVKTRLQSPQGFWKAGGFRGIYAGVPSTAIGSFPNAAAFFITYENVKSVLPHGSASYLTPVTHMVAASSGEVVACLIRVPSEVVKQRAQVSPSASTFRILSHTLYHEGIQGLYRGYKSTVLRERPVGEGPLGKSHRHLEARGQGWSCACIYGSLLKCLISYIHPAAPCAARGFLSLWYNFPSGRP
nr:S-adenosylmethionine mitochondrial carrier protein isoform X5 [Anser cygnoides]